MWNYMYKHFNISGRKFIWIFSSDYIELGVFKYFKIQFQYFIYLFKPTKKRHVATQDLGIQDELIKLVVAMTIKKYHN